VLWRVSRRVAFDAYTGEDDDLTERPFARLTKARPSFLGSAEFQNGRHAQVSTDCLTQCAR